MGDVRVDGHYWGYRLRIVYSLLKLEIKEKLLNRSQLEGKSLVGDGISYKICRFKLFDFSTRFQKKVILSIYYANFVKLLPCPHTCQSES